MLSLALMADQVGEAKRGDLADLAEGGDALLFGGVLQAHGKGGEDRVLLVQPRADHEGKSEARFVVAVVAVEERDFLRR